MGISKSRVFNFLNNHSERCGNRGHTTFYEDNTLYSRVMGYNFVHKPLPTKMVILEVEKRYLVGIIYL